MNKQYKSTVTILIVARNEGKNLLNLLSYLEKQTYPLELIDIIFVDSNSSDDTKYYMSSYSETSKFRTIKIYDNKAVSLAPGWNIGLRKFTTDYIVRIDAHATITDNFIEENVKLLDAGEFVTGGPRPNIINPLKNSHFSKYLLAAEKALFGSSIAYYRNGKDERYVSSVFHGMFKREVITKVGYFNEKLGRTEDNDYFFRVRQNGYRILYSPNIKSYQFVRETLRGMLQQKFANGYWIGKTTFINYRCLSMFHYAPLLLTVLTCLSLVVMKFTYLPTLLVLLPYLFIICFTSIYTVKLEKLSFLGIFILPVLLVLLHYSYGIGTMKGLWSGFRKD